MKRKVFKKAAKTLNKVVRIPTVVSQKLPFG